MGRFRKVDDPDQGLLLPPSLRDWLPEDHLAWFIKETVDQLNIDSLLGSYRVCGKGELAYPPRVMLSLLIYAYCTGTFSSRRIATQIEESIAFRVLAAGAKPSHRTICRFREGNLDEFKRLFVQVVQVAQEAGLVKMGVVAIDGTKVKADASKHKAMSYDRMLTEEKRLREEIGKLTRAAQNQDEVDDKAFGPHFRGNELPAELRRRKDRLAVITSAKKRLEERKAAEAKAKASDEDGPGAAKACDSASPEKSTAETSPATTTSGEQAVDQQASKPEAAPPANATADGSTASRCETVFPEPRDQENFTDPDSRIMPTGSRSFEQCFNAQIAVDGKAQIVVAASVSQSPKDMGLLLPVVREAIANTAATPVRLLADAGYKNERDLVRLKELGIDGYVSIGREGKTARPPSDKCPSSQAMQKKLATKRGREFYGRRKSIVEPVFGWVKRVLGFRSFSLRGLRKVAGEWSLVCMALNLRRMAAMGIAK